VNYRHHYHAGNFADLMKHALWLSLLKRLTAHPRPLAILDTHAGAGVYALDGPMARRSAEADTGVLRLVSQTTAPGVFDPLRGVIASENVSEQVTLYPGSPLITLHALRPGDSYLGCELRPDDYAALSQVLRARAGRGRPSARALHADGYAELARFGQGGGGGSAAIIDPPYERGDERERLVSGVSAALGGDGGPVLALWAPLKDLESLDSILRGLEALRPRRLQVAEVRLRPLADPLRMNGSAMIFINGPDLAADAQDACAWIASACGEAGAASRVRTLCG
jgi:23S rRNA (adenine2030-N6)-methyltransferase